MPPETTRKPAAIRVSRQGARIGQHLLLVIDELRLHGLQEAHRLGGHDVHQRTALDAGEDVLIDGRGILLLGQDDAGARPAQRLVGGGSDDVGVLAGVGMQARGHQPGDVRHVHHQDRAHRIGGLAEAREIQRARVGAAAGDDHLGLVLERQPVHLVVIDALVFLAHAVGNHVVGLAGEVELDGRASGGRRAPGSAP